MVPYIQDALMKLNLEHERCNRPNQPADSVSEFSNNELQQRFDASNMMAYKGLAIVPSKLIGSLNKGSKLCWKEKFLCFANFY